MKLSKLSLCAIVVGVLATSSMAGGSVMPKDMELTVNLGGSVDYIKDNGGEKSNYDGVNAGFGVYKRVGDIALGSEFEASFMEQYKNYAVEMNAKYYVTPKLALVGGVGYSYYDIDEGGHMNGYGLQAKVEYAVAGNFGVYAKYKFEDLDKDADYAHKVSTGIMYKF